jgi:cytochrome c biogenesis protein CcmG/thiol:disulfide interchange protein DsbE
VKHPTRWVALGVGLVIVALAVVMATQVGGDPTADSTTSQLLGERAPDFTVTTLDGEQVTLGSLAGRPVLVNFWNTWCPPCEEELPALKEFARRHAEDPDFELVGIVRDDGEDAVRRYVKAEGLDWTIGMDPDAAAALAFGTRGQPETFAINAAGRIVGTQIGAASLRDFEALLDAAQGNPR